MAKVILEVLLNFGLYQVLCLKNSLIDRIEELKKHVDVKRTVEELVVVLLAKTWNEQLLIQIKTFSFWYFNLLKLFVLIRLIQIFINLIILLFRC